MTTANIIPNVPPRPAYATGQLNLSIPPQQRTLSLQVEPDQSRLEPGGETTLNVMVKDANGLPVQDAELAVVVVDESILALTNYELSDPISVFYTDRPSYLSSIYGRASVVLVDPQSLARDQKVALSKDTVAEAGAMPAPAAAEAPTMTALPATGGGDGSQAPVPISCSLGLQSFGNLCSHREDGFQW